MRWLTPILTTLLLAVAAAPAAAQLPVPGLPVPPPTGSPAPTDPAPNSPPPAPSGPSTGAGEVVSTDGDPAGDANAADASVFGPLERRWAKEFPGQVTQPLIVGGKLVFTVADSDSALARPSVIVAVDPATGTEAWRQTLPGITGIAANGGRILALGADNQVHAFDVTTGAQAWSTPIAGGVGTGPLVAASGTVFVTQTAEGRAATEARLDAFAVDSGQLRWQTPLSMEVGGDRPVLDANNVYVATDQGAAQAIAQTTGQVLWTTRGDATPSLTRSLIAGGRLYAARYSFDLGSGQRAPWTGTWPRAAGGDAMYSASTAPEGNALVLEASRLADGARLWSFKPSKDLGEAVASPLIAGPTVFTASAWNVYGIDRVTGKLLSTTPIGGTASSRDGSTALASSGGLLFVAGMRRLSAYEPVLRPAQAGADIAANKFTSTAGQLVSLVGGVKPDLRGSAAKMQLGFDNFPDGKFGVGATTDVLPDGTGYFTARPTRNVRYRVTSAGATSRSIRVYVYPSQRWKVRATSRTRGLIIIRLKAGRDYKPGGKTLVVYLGRTAKKRYERLGSARVRANGRGRGRADVAFKLLKNVGAKDSLVYCVPGQAKAGWGAYDHFERNCGRARIKF